MFLGGRAVINLDELNSMLITVIINLLQLLDDLKRVVIVFAIFEKNDNQTNE
jgi:plasmid replication initiation protein